MTFNDIQIRNLERGSVFEPFKIADPISEKMDPDFGQFSEMHFFTVLFLIMTKNSMISIF